MHLILVNNESVCVSLTHIYGAHFKYIWKANLTFNYFVLIDVWFEIFQLKFLVVFILFLNMKQAPLTVVVFIIWLMPKIGTEWSKQ